MSITGQSNEVQLIFIGGCGHFGMNMTAYIFREQLYIVDAGVDFADDHLIGIDAVIPDISPLIQKYKKVTAYIITHGHEDHIGALSLLLSSWPAPVICSSWTNQILQDRLRRYRLDISPEVEVIRTGDNKKMSDFHLSFFGIPHSIPDCMSVLFNFNGIKILHTGDFKLTPKKDQESYPDIKQLSAQGPVTAIVADSTNSHKEGYCPGEDEVTDSLFKHFQSTRGTTYISTFSSNFWRLQTILECAYKLNKAVFILGASILKTLDIASSEGKSFHSDVIIEEADLNSIPRSDLIVLTTGCQGEYRAGLKRLLQQQYKYLSPQQEDKLILSSRVIPGNEKSVAELISWARYYKLEVITTREDPSIHVSGHAYKNDLRDVLLACKAKYHIPVHGTHSQLQDNALLHTRPISVENNRSILITESEVHHSESFDFEMLYVDSWSKRTLSQASMRSRHKIGDSGLCLISGTLNNHSVEFFGIPISSDEETRVRLLIDEHLQDSINKSKNLEDINQVIQHEVRRFLSSVLVKKPVILSRLCA